MRRDLNELAAMLYPKAEDVVRDGFGGSLPSREVFGTAAADSDGGMVLVELDGDVEVDEDAEGGDAVFVEVPCSASVRAGDRVSVTVQDGSMIDVGSPGWGDRVNAAAAAAATLAQEAKDIADAIGQYAWNDTNGTHVSTEEGVAEGTRNILLNSYGILLRAAANYLAALSQSGIAFYDGQGNLAENIVASFGASGAQVGSDAQAHLQIDGDSVDVVDPNAADPSGIVLSMGYDQTNARNFLTAIFQLYLAASGYADNRAALNLTSPDHGDVVVEQSASCSDGTSMSASMSAHADQSTAAMSQHNARIEQLCTLLDSTEGGQPVTRAAQIALLAVKSYYDASSNYHAGRSEVNVTADAVNVTGTTHHHGNIEFDNGNEMFGKTSGGTRQQMFGLNANDQFVLNYGGYANQNVPTNVEGNEILLLSRGAINFRVGTAAAVDYAPTDWAYLVGSSSGNRVRYCKRAGVVFVEVWYESGAAVGTTAKTLGTLPAGFRPSLQVETCAFGNVNNLAYLRVNPGGGIVAKSMSGTMNYFKGCISFPV